MRAAVVAALAALSGALAAPAELQSRALLSPAAALSVFKTCQAIAANVSSASAVFCALTSRIAADAADPGSVQYLQDIEHYSLTNTAASVCTFEPGSPQDVSKALKIIAANSAPWAVKSQGHLTIPLSSSTQGVQISMTRFNQVTLSADKSTATIGAGNGWSDVYKVRLAIAHAQVDLLRRSILPRSRSSADVSRASALRASASAAGAQRSTERADASATATAPTSAPPRLPPRLTARRVGLTIDTIQSYDLVLPNGTITAVTAANPDLFFVLKGGFNTAGIVTSFTLSTQSFTQVWGGINLCVYMRDLV